MVSKSKGESTTDLRSDGSVGISPGTWFIQPHFLACRKRSCPYRTEGSPAHAPHKQFYSVNSCSERYDILGLCFTSLL